MPDPAPELRRGIGIRDGILLTIGSMVGSGIFLSADAPRRARAIVTAVTCWEDPRKLAEVSTGLGAAMRSIDVGSLAEHERFAGRGA